MKMERKQRTFIKVTNEMIYEEIQQLKKHVLDTNGKVKLNRWISTTALSICLILVGFLIKGGLGG